MVNSFQQYQDQIDKSPSLIFSGSSNDNDANEVFLFIINPEKIEKNKTSLKYNDEIIDLQVSASFQLVVKLGFRGA